MNLGAIAHLPLNQQIEFIVTAEQFPDAVRRFKRSYLEAALRKARGHVPRAARIAGIHPLSFISHATELGIPLRGTNVTRRS